MAKTKVLFFVRRNQANSTPQSDSSSQWDFDLLDSKLSNTKNVTGATTSDTPTNLHTPVLDPFDMDSLAAQETRSFTASSPANRVNEIEDKDDNPLGILAEPARPRPSTPSPPPPVASQSPSLQQHRQHSSPSVTHGRIMLSEDEEDAMMAQLIDMGFSLQESKFAIEATGGHDVQAAIDLLVQNSEIAQRRQPTNINQRGNAPQKEELSQNERARDALFSDDAPAPRSSSSRRQHQQQQKQQKQSQHQQQESGQKNHASAAAAEGDDTLQHQAEKVVMQAQELGGFLYKNATSFLKTGREKVTKAVGDWQEQQREQRLRQMQEEQGGPIRPKWMKGGDETVDVSNTNTIEKFADDDDSDNEELDMEAERRKIQEMRRLQELKQREQAAAAHKARQQQNLRKEALILKEEVYVSPSRRRGNTPSSSGKSTPPSNSTTTNGSPAPQPQQMPKSARPSQQQKPSPQPAARSATPRERTRPVVNVSADVMAKANAARNQGNEKFKLGQFGEAEEAYSLAIDILPAGHDHQVLLCNNRAMARLKIGHYKKCVEDCDTAITLSKQSGDGSINSEGVVIEWRGQIVKSLHRKAEALENIEKYKDALATYDELVKYEGTGNLKVNQGMSRCRLALNPKKTTTSAAPSKLATPPPSSQQQKKEDFMSIFDPTAATTTSSSTPSTPTVSAEELSKSRAVAAMRAKAAEQEAEDAEKLEKTDEVNARLLAWKAGKEQNLRTLLATVDTLLWPGAQWKGAQMSELINPKKCKIIYMKAIGKVHPDKVR